MLSNEEEVINMNMKKLNKRSQENISYAHKCVAFIDSIYSDRMVKLDEKREKELIELYEGVFEFYCWLSGR